MTRVLGRGCFGTVYRGVRRIDRYPVAAKVLPYSHEAYREVCILRSVAHTCAHFVRYEHAVARDKMLFVIMLQVGDGRTVAQLRRRVPAPMQLRIVEHVALALEHLHLHGFCHGDVKAENILLENDDHFVLADCGHSGRAHVPAHGDVRYRAPEKRLSPAADIFALGLLLAELVAQGSFDEWVDGPMRPWCEEADFTETMQQLAEDAALPAIQLCLCKMPRLAAAERPTATEVVRLVTPPDCTSPRSFA